MTDNGGKPGPTGDYPRGKLNEDDQGGLQIGLHVEGDTVLMFFSTPVEWLGFGPADARNLAQLLIDHAEQAEASLQ